MNDLFEYAIQNVAFTFVLTIAVLAITRWLQNPPIAHLLWVLVLLKLVTPPLFEFELPVAGASAQATPTATFFLQPDATALAPTLDKGTPFLASPSRPSSLPTSDLHQIWNRVETLLGWIWLLGTLSFVGIAVSRIWRFERLLRGTLPASERHQNRSNDIAQKIGLKRLPDVRYIDSVNVPLAWCAFRQPIVVLPLKLVQQFDDDKLAMIQAHELAHLRRRDHLVRGLELFVTAIYWWNPLVWIVRRQIHQTEDLCCDAWVRSVFPESSACYANVLFETSVSLADTQMESLPFTASTFLRSPSLKARIEMILQSKFAPQASVKSVFFIALIGTLVLPTFFRSSAATAIAEEARTEKPDQALPHRVAFEQGAMKFAEGDDITILEIRGTAKEFIPGNIYWIKGTYELNSQNSAMLAAYTTAKHAKDGKSKTMKVQSMNIEKGKGTFTLILPMLCEGWPHVSFYNGEGFGGNYFGTGETVLKKWWN